MTNAYSSNDQADASTRVLRTQTDGANAKETVSEAKDAITEKAGEVVDKVKQQANTQVGSQMSQVSEKLGSVALAIRQTGTQLHSQEQANLAQYTDKAADHIERLSTYLREADLGQISGEVERFARRQPALFLGGAIALGLFGARFLKSSSKQEGQDWQGYYGDYSNRGMGGYSYSGYSYAGSDATGNTSSPYIDRSQGAEYQNDYQGGDSISNQDSSSDGANVRQRTWTGTNLEES